MKIEAFSVVTLRYTLKNAQGEILDQSDENEPLVYMHGTDYLVSGLEKALLNHEKGDKFSVAIKAEDAYGPYNENLVQRIPITMFGGEELAINDSYIVETPEGERTVVIKEIKDNMVKVDANHPLAGLDLYFDLEVLDVREPTAEEKDHKHVHLHGHCCHDHEHDHEGHCCHHHDHDEEHEHDEHCCHKHHHDHDEHHHEHDHDHDHDHDEHHHEHDHE